MFSLEGYGLTDSETIFVFSKVHYIYADDIIYFSANNDVEKKFEELLSTIGRGDFMGHASLFHGTEFTWIHHDDGHVTLSLTQQSFMETLIESLSMGYCS
jgi:hypothetical protein